MADLKKVLFISHDATRTGAPIRFLNLLRWIRKNTEIPFLILLRNDGELKPEFEKLAPTMLMPQAGNGSLKERVLRRLGYRFHSVSPPGPLGRLRKEGIGLIYSNTITNGEVLRKLAFLQCPVVSAVNEMEFAIWYCANHTFETTKNITNRFVACSEAVKNSLIDHRGISSDMIEVVHGFIPISAEQHHRYSSAAKKILSELKIPGDAFIVGASGTIDWRKGADLFPYLARIVASRLPDAPIYFLWLGGDTTDSNDEYFKLQLEISKLGQQERIRFIGSKSNPLDYYGLFDVFVMISREDPFPLVCLEAAALGKPILCFEKAGGMPEFVEDDCGFVVPYLDLDAMADRIVELYRSEELRKRLGENAAKKVRERHDIERSAPKIAALILDYLKG